MKYHIIIRVFVVALGITIITLPVALAAVNFSSGATQATSQEHVCNLIIGQAMTGTAKSDIYSVWFGHGLSLFQFLTDINEDDKDLLPGSYTLKQNYPNPFNPVTMIEYSLPERTRVKIEVYNVLGQKVRTLVDHEESAGTYTVTWDGKTAKGNSASSGIYLYRIEAGDYHESKKMLLLK